MAKPISAALGLRPFDSALSFRPQRGTRIVLVPRDGGALVVTETEALVHFHINNAYEDEKGQTVIEIVEHDSTGGWAGWNGYLRDYRGVAGPTFGGRLTRLTFDPRRRSVRRTELFDRGCEFPQVDPRRATGEHRFTYLAASSTDGGDPDTITTIDHVAGATRSFIADGANTVCEPLFAVDPDGDGEVDGWLLTVEHQPAQRRSRVLVLPAHDPSAGPLATFGLRHHIPMTFHGAFVPA